MNTQQYLDNSSGKNISYVDGINYNDAIASEIVEDSPKLNCSLSDVLKEFGFNDDINAELTDKLTEFIEDEIRLSCIEFIKRLTLQLNQSKQGHALLRALGYSCDGLSLKQASLKYGCSAQYIHKLSNDIAEHLGIEPIASLGVVRKYSRNMKVKCSDDWYTLKEAQKYLKLDGRKLKKLIDDNDIPIKGHIRNSKLIHQDSLDKLQKIIEDNDNKNKK
jgi:hypothetical protein